MFKFSTGGAVAVVIALLDCIPAAAQTPIIAGDYVATIRVYCQPTLNLMHNNGSVDTVGLGASGLTSYSIELEYYDPRTIILTQNGYTESGSPVLLADDRNGTSGSPLAETHDSIITFYANGFQTVTINRVVYHVTWGLLKNTVLFEHVPMNFTLVGIDPHGCVSVSEHVRR